MFDFTHRLRIVSLVFGAAVAVTFASTGCVTHHYSRGPGVYSVTAPPRSASHGYVHHYRDAVLVFDRSWNGYSVRSRPHHYFYSNQYYRWDSGRWHRARYIRGPWVTIELSAVPAGLHHRGAVKHRRDERRDSAREQREDRRQVVKQVKQRREDRREVVRERREDRREAVKEKREDRRQVVKQVKQRREDRREVVKEKREDRREVVKEKREDRREAVKEKREDRRQVVRDRRQDRREIAESQKTRRVAKASAGAARGSVEHRRRKVREDEDEERPASHRVE